MIAVAELWPAPCSGCGDRSVLSVNRNRMADRQGVDHVARFNRLRRPGCRRSMGETMQYKQSEVIGDQPFRFRTGRRLRVAAATAAIGLVLTLVAACTSSQPSAASALSAAGPTE